ncbi:hypothetical protein EDD15DRAFT_50820 [Pisolithus albus]|nr:hypothetical protein EDD15DRAFT_50820 [Pisolithus albus]
MLADLPKATAISLSPTLMLTVIFFILLAYLAPAAILHGQVALLAVTPSTILTQPGLNQQVDGPTLCAGLLGSCSKPHYDAPGLTCTTPYISPAYTMSAFTTNTPSSVLAIPPAVTWAFLAVALGFTFACFVMYCAIFFRHLIVSFWEKPVVQKLFAWIGFGSFLVGKYCGCRLGSDGVLTYSLLGIASFFVLRIFLDAVHLLLSNAWNVTMVWLSGQSGQRGTEETLCKRE